MLFYQLELRVSCKPSFIQGSSRSSEVAPLSRFWEKGAGSEAGNSPKLEREVVCVILFDMRSDCPSQGIKKEPSQNLTQPCQGNEEGKAEGNVACMEPGLGLAWEVQVFEHERGKFGVEPK